MWATALAAVVQPPEIIFLEGPLGAGKTTFFRYFLKALGFTGYAKSPSFTLIETYVVPFCTVVHIDLYRLNQANELEALGLSDYLEEEVILVVEWADRVQNQLLKPTLLCNIKIPTDGMGRSLEMQLSSLARPALRTWFENI